MFSFGIGCLCALILFLGNAQAVYRPDAAERSKESSYPSDRFLVKRKGQEGFEVVQFSPGVSLRSAIALEGLKDDIEYAEPDYYIHPSSMPNDPLQADPGFYHLARISAPSAWDINVGSPQISVCVIDTGLDPSHPDLTANLVRDGKGNVVWHNALNDGMSCFDDDGHGTHCAGVVGASGNNGVGVVGVNWQVSILPCRAMGGPHSRGTISTFISCMNWCKGVGARVISASLGWAPDGFSQTALATIQQSGALLVAAAGNRGTSVVQFPAAYDLPNVISVGATGSDDALARFSSFGPKVHLAAPGVDIWSTVPQFVRSATPGYIQWSGTSMAVPAVAGAAALAMAAAARIHVDLDPPTLKNLLLGAVDPLDTLRDRVATGGRLNAFKMVQPFTPPPQEFLKSGLYWFMLTSGETCTEACRSAGKQALRGRGRRFAVCSYYVDKTFWEGTELSGSCQGAYLQGNAARTFNSAAFDYACGCEDAPFRWIPYHSKCGNLYPNQQSICRTRDAKTKRVFMGWVGYQADKPKQMLCVVNKEGEPAWVERFEYLCTATKRANKRVGSNSTLATEQRVVAVPAAPANATAPAPSR